MVTDAIEDGLPRVRLRHLRDLDERCGLRLAHERAGTRGAGRPSGDHGRFAVMGRLTQDARVAHTEMRAPTIGDFPTPNDLFHEQQRLYAVSARGYLAVFGDRPARAVDVDRWAGERADLGVEVVVPLDLVVRDEAGRLEIRLLRSRRREVDDPERSLIRSRLRTLDEPVVHVVTADLLTLAVAEETVDLTETAAADDAFLLDATAQLEALTSQRQPRRGGDCRDCPYVAHCPPMRRDWTEVEVRAAQR